MRHNLERDEGRRGKRHRLLAIRLALRALRDGRSGHLAAKSGRTGQRIIAAWIVLILAVARPVAAADLESAASAAFDRYALLTQAKFDAENSRRSPFLWIDSLPDARRNDAYAQLRLGQVVIDRLETIDQGKPIPVPGGIIHHWIGTAFIPGATLAQTLAFEQDYDHQADDFRPNVIGSKILRHSGPDFTIDLRLHEKKVITVVLDTEDQIHYATIDATHAWSRSWATRVQQVDHAGQPNENLEPEGHDGGFLWRLNTYWRFEEKDGGTYVESQSVSLTRDIPTGLGWMIGPYVTSIPRESLTFMLSATRAAILKRIASG